jgi:tRNA pseudouridine38-40 synthase
MEDQRYLFKFYYIGSKKYYGSQRQHDLLTIEDILIRILQERGYIIDVKTSNFEVASRTDRLVSARGAVFSITTNKKPILMEINSGLPKDIGIWCFANVPIDFSPRYNAILRHYRYIVPQRLSTLTVEYGIDITIIQKACKELEGNHDFINFSKVSKDSNEKTLRTMNSVDVLTKNNYLIFDFKSKGFLRQQIRRMVKKLLELGKGEINLNEFLSLFDTIKTVSFQPADPKGLLLWDIHYDKSITLIHDQKSKERMIIYFKKQKEIYGVKHQLFEELMFDL